jgi:hypothetical protein
MLVGMPRTPKHLVLPLFSLPLLALALGCEIGAIGNAGTGGTVDDAPACEGPLGAPRDPATLTACCTDFVGGAHCLGSDVVPDFLHDFLGGCEGGGYCVPDKFIVTGGVFTPKACNSLQDAPGACLSGCIPQVYDYWGLLPEDVCDPDERCVPCVNPFDGTDTGACAISYTCDQGPIDDPRPDPGVTCPHEGPPIIDPSTFPACDTCGGAHCVPDALVPGDLAERLAPCAGGGKCVPDEFIATGGNHIPATCPSIAGAEGRCLSRCLPEVAAQAALLPQSDCAATHLCVPCYDPLDGTPTGACGLSCDPGPEGDPTTLPACCEGMGTCVPAQAAGDAADQLGADTCPDELLCAPNVFLDGMFAPPPCETGLVSFLFGADYKPGVCLPGCLPAVQNFLLGRDGCDQGYKCAPCLDPLTGQPTGACEL